MLEYLAAKLKASWWCEDKGLKSKGINKVRRIHPLGTMDIWSKFHDNLLNSWRYISVWTKAKLVDQQTDITILWLHSKVMLVQSSTPTHGLYFDSTQRINCMPPFPVPHSLSISDLNVITMHLWAHALLYWHQHQLRLPRELSMKYGLCSSYITPHDGSMLSYLLLYIHIHITTHTCSCESESKCIWFVALAQINIYYLFNNERQ